MSDSNSLQSNVLEWKGKQKRIAILGKATRQEREERERLEDMMRYENKRGSDWKQKWSEGGLWYKSVR